MKYGKTKPVDIINKTRTPRIIKYTIVLTLYYELFKYKNKNNFNYLISVFVQIDHSYQTDPLYS